MGEPLAGIQVEIQDNVAVLRPWGVLDLEGAAEIRGTLDEAAAAPANRYVMDLVNVSFMDGSGVHELLRVVSAVQSKGGHLSVVNPKPQFRRLLVLTGCARHLGLLPAFPTASSF